MYFLAFDEPEEEIIHHPEWILEVPEDLDVLVAQRHFEDALNLLNRAKEYISQQNVSKNEFQDPVLNDIQRKVLLYYCYL